VTWLPHANAYPAPRWRLTAWQLFVCLLILALGAEYWDKNPARLPNGIAVPWPRFVLAMAVTPLVVAGAWRWSVLLRLPREMRPLMIFHLGCALSLVGLVLHPLAPDGIAQFARTFTHLSLYVLLVYVIVKHVTWDRLRLLVGAYYVLGVGAALFALLQFVSGALGVLPWMSALYFRSAHYDVGAGLTMGFRASSIFGEPSWAARYYVHWIALACGYWWFTRRRRHLVALVVFLLAFYVANSLMGYVLLGVFAGGLLATQMWRRNMFSLSTRKKAVLGALAYAALIAWLLGAQMPLPDLFDRTVRRVELVLQGAGGSGNRWDSIFAGLEVWRRAPVFGVGLGNIDGHIVQFYTDKAYIFRSYFGSDSLYVQFLGETGLVGLLGFLYFWLNLILFRIPGNFSTRNFAPGAAQAYGWLRLLQMDALAQAVGMLNYSDYLSPHLWTVVGITLACRALVRREAAPAETERVPTGLPRFTTAPAG
jgi:O-antigen ligase/polysaccharide polymerase Wzy-like membrane protein